MTQGIIGKELNISRDFQNCAERIDRDSYRKVVLNVTHHAPGFPHVLERTSIRIFDRVETGLYDLMVLRAVLENPSMGPFLMPYISAQSKIMPGCQSRLRAQYNMVPPSPVFMMDSSEITHWLKRTEIELEGLGGLNLAFPKTFAVKFAGRNDVDNIAALESGAQSKYLPRTRKTLQDWIIAPADGQNAPPRQAEAPLHAAQIKLAPVTKAKDLEDARKRVSPNLVRPQDPAAPVLVLFH